MYRYLTCVCTFWRVKSDLCIPWSRYLCMYVCTPQIYVCVYVCIPTIYVCVYICISGIYVCVYVCMSELHVYVCGHFYVYEFFMYIESQISFFWAVIFDQKSFVKVVDFVAGDVMRGHGRF